MPISFPLRILVPLTCFLFFFKSELVSYIWMFKISNKDIINHKIAAKILNKLISISYILLYFVIDSYPIKIHLLFSFVDYSDFTYTILLQILICQLFQVMMTLLWKMLLVPYQYKHSNFGAI